LLGRLNGQASFVGRSGRLLTGDRQASMPSVADYVLVFAVAA
jgi:hypothetical protein